VGVFVLPCFLRRINDVVNLKVTGQSFAVPLPGYYCTKNRAKLCKSFADKGFMKRYMLENCTFSLQKLYDFGTDIIRLNWIFPAEISDFLSKYRKKYF
jgi:hypothetical protein